MCVFNTADRQREENVRKFNNCVPDDLILSIKQAEIPKEFLGPPNKKTLQNPKPTIPVWFTYLLYNPNLLKFNSNFA